jgi:hypothetical protein
MFQKDQLWAAAFYIGDFDYIEIYKSPRGVEFAWTPTRGFRAHFARTRRERRKRRKGCGDGQLRAPSQKLPSNHRRLLRLTFLDF